MVLGLALSMTQLGVSFIEGAIFKVGLNLQPCRGGTQKPGTPAKPSIRVGVFFFRFPLVVSMGFSGYFGLWFPWEFVAPLVSMGICVCSKYVLGFVPDVASGGREPL